MRRYLVLAAVLVVLGAAAALLLATSNAPAPGTLVETVTLPGPGRVLADSAGQALFVYTPDDRGPSRCVAACAVAWPPLVLPAGVRHAGAGRGVQAALLGTTRRPDGSLQVTYDRWPLYLDRDETRGALTGQGDGMGAWYLLAPNGTVDRQPVLTTPVKRSTH